MSRVPSRRRARWIASLAAGSLVLGAASLAVPPTTAADAAAEGSGLATPHPVELPDSKVEPRTGVPETGRHTFLLKLDTRSTGRVFAANRAAGRATAGAAARSQFDTVTEAQEDVVDALPADTPVLYRAHAALAAVAVSADVADLGELRQIPGVARVYPIAPKARDNGYAVPLQGAPTAWEGDADLGADTTIGIVDTGIDFTHANFGGTGTPAAYDAEHAHADEASLWEESVFPTAKVVGGWDLVGDDYNADLTGAALIPHPDPNPLDCQGADHGSHVAGSAAGLGVTSAGAPYAGAYDTTTDFDSMRIGPGMAPRAKLLAFRVFGCGGSTNVTAAGIDRALDPNGDGSTSDAVDVLNLSLGSPYGSTDDGDTAVADAAALLGVTMVFSAGNSYDLYDVGGSPGTSRRAITVAASADAQTMVDRVDLSYSLGGGASMGASSATAYGWGDHPDLTGQLVVPTSNLTGCYPFSGGEIAGKVALLSFTWYGTSGDPCGSTTRANNVAAAGGVGYIFTSSNERFTTGVAGNATVPGVMVTSTDGAAIRAAISDGNVVTVGGTVTNGFAQRVPADDDTMTDFSSRGIRGAGHLKPDVAAVGGTVFSTAAGTGSEGMTMSGTSMAAPMVAGLSALVISAHPDWTPEQVKADIMNTAGQDLDTNGSAAPGGDRYAPNRVGAGRIQADMALVNEVLAYVVDDPGAVSVSFGPVEVTEPMTLTKMVKIQNTGSTTRTYDTSYDAITSVPGVSYEVVPASVTVAAGQSKSATVTFSVTDPALLTKTFDPTHGDVWGSDPSEILADASGNLLLTPTAGGVPELRVPVYSAPRPASVMSQPDSLTLDGTGEGELTLEGQDVEQGAGEELVTSLTAGLELQVNSPLAPACGGDVTTLCVSGLNDRGADLEYVGVTSDAPYYSTPSSGQAYFGIATHGARSTAASKFEFDVYIDANEDGTTDAIAYTSRLKDSDVFVTALIRASNGAVLHTNMTNNRLGDVDTAIFDSDVLLMPVKLAALTALGVDAGSPRVSYAVASFADNAVDRVGFGTGGSVDGSLTADLYNPGVLVSGDGDIGGEGGANTDYGPLVKDLDSAEIAVVRGPSYVADRGQGLLMLHFHNKVGDKAQVVALKSPSTVSLVADPTTVTRGAPTTLTVTVDDPDGSEAPTGTVQVTKGVDGPVVASGPLASGVASLSYTPLTTGVRRLVASYAGDASYASGSSAEATLTVMPASRAVTLGVTPASVVRGGPVALTIGVTQSPGDPVPTGAVTVLDGSGATVASGTLGAGGTATLSFNPRKPRTLSLHAAYAGDSNTVAGASVPASVTVAKARPKPTLSLPSAKGKVGVKVRAKVSIPTVLGIAATGKVVLKSGSKTLGTARLSGGRSTFTFKLKKAGKVSLKVSYAGDGTYSSGVSGKKTYTAKKPKKSNKR